LLGITCLPFLNLFLFAFLIIVPCVCSKPFLKY
jgi:hypothetical protein